MDLLYGFLRFCKERVFSIRKYPSFISFGLLFFSLWTTGAKAEPTELIFWHSLAGHLGSEVNRVADLFNRSQNEFVVKPIYKGDYNECLTSLAAAFRAKQAPPLVQVFEIGTPTMLAPKGIIKPVDAIMQEHGLSLPKESFFPAVLAYYSVNGRLVAMPFNTSVPVMFYNAEALAKVGYTPQNFPKTWDEFETMAVKLKSLGYPCVYTSANPAWILIESFSALHGLPLIDPLKSKAQYNNKSTIQFLERLRRWQNEHYFEYGGRTDDSSVLFTSGRCPVYSQSSGGYNSLAELVSFPVGMAMMPMDNRISQNRHPNVSGGAAVWVIEGHSNLIYKGVAKYLAFLSRPEVQLQWHQNTGYLPLGITGIYESLQEKMSAPTLQLAKKELLNREDIVEAKMQNQLRVINDEALEAIFSGIKTPKQAMDNAVARANHALLRFSRNTG
ncbi:glycerol-3-phosphate ABC transporter substrate-binding protein [Legionella impletisoli]|uniref:sn-glycerol-3-phosphate-binding periplasmic protein UgpB n=2 Tax=Legionella impletisoli TaxID=343510 RepID=A0A917JU99_9GAMM|nr:extracellular solute-binding protein [Legionella impletisoli]GGI81575.1 glycerol-3-phosphate ABC transporter substrate-binding protein [Legionella impletisoli]